MSTEESIRSEKLRLVNDWSKFEEYETEILPKFEYPVDGDQVCSPYWLEKTLGSLAEERRKSPTKQYYAYNRQVEKARRFFKEDFSLLNLLLYPENFNIKLSDLEALYPSLSFFLQINIQDLTKSNQRLLRSFLIFYYQLEEIPKWISYLVEEELDKILQVKKYSSGGKVFRENFIIRQSFITLGKLSALELLKGIYSEQNLEKWNKTGRSLCKSSKVIKIPYAIVRERIRRRGYKESSSNNHKSKSQEGRVKMSKENRSLEEIKQSILKKQALMFERRLDAYLAMTDPDVDKIIKKQIFEHLLDYEFSEDSDHSTLDEKLKIEEE